MSYTPINALAYTAAYSGVVAGMAVGSWITSATIETYEAVTEIAGAFAQEFDIVWDNNTSLNELESRTIMTVVQNEFANRQPALNNETYTDPATWEVPARACAALVLQGDAYFASQGITPTPATVARPFVIADLVDGTGEPTPEDNAARLQAYLDSGPDYAPWVIEQAGQFFIGKPVRLHDKIGLSGLGAVTEIKALAEYGAGPIFLFGATRDTFPQAAAILDDADFSFEFQTSPVYYMNLSDAGVYPKDWDQLWIAMPFMVTGLPPGIPCQFINLGGGVGTIDTAALVVEWDIGGKLINVRIRIDDVNIDLQTTTEFDAPLNVRHMLNIGYNGANVFLFVDGIIEDSAAATGLFTTKAWEELVIGTKLRGGFPGREPFTAIPPFNLGGFYIGNVCQHTTNYTVDWNIPTPNPANGDEAILICTDDRIEDDLTKLSYRGNSYSYMQTRGPDAGLTTFNISLSDLKITGSVENLNTAVQVWASPLSKIARIESNCGQAISSLGNCYLSNLQEIKSGVSGGRFGVAWLGGLLTVQGGLRVSSADIPIVLSGSGSIDLIHCFSYTTIGVILDKWSGTISDLAVSDEDNAPGVHDPLYALFILENDTAAALQIGDFGCDITTSDVTIPIAIDSPGAAASQNIKIFGGGGFLGGLTTPPEEMVKFLSPSITDPIEFDHWNSDGVPASLNPEKILGQDGRSKPLNIETDADEGLNYRDAACHRLPLSTSISDDRVYTFETTNIQAGRVMRFIRENNDPFLVTVNAPGAESTYFESNQVGWCDYIYDPKTGFERIAYNVNDTWTPQQLGAKLEMWLRADQGVLNPSGDPAVDEDLVATWEDLNDNEHNGTADIGQRPEWLADGGPNATPAVNFQGTQFIAFATQFNTLTEAEVFYVLKFDADPPINPNINTVAYLSDAPSDCAIPAFTGDVFSNFGSTTRVDAIFATSGRVASWALWNEISTATERTVQLNGVQEYTNATNTVGFSALVGRIGAGGFGGKMNGLLAEVVLCNAKLTAQEKEDLETYFVRRYPALPVTP